MFPWQIWIILLIAAGTFILLNLLRSREEARRQPPRARNSARRASDESEGGRQEPITDLDRFLREVHSRRSAAGAEPPAARPAPERPRKSSPLPTGRVAPPPKRRSGRPEERSTTRRSNVSETPLEAIPVAIAVEVPVRAEPQPSTPNPYVVGFPGASPMPPAPSTAGPIAASMSRPGQGAFVGLLSSRQSLRDVMILREIFDPPLCKRRPKM